MKTLWTFRYFHGLYIFTICPWFCLKEKIYYLIQCWIFPSVTITGTKIIIFSNLMVIVQWRSVKYWSKNWQTQKLLSSSSTTICLRIAAEKQNVTEGTFLSQRGLCHDFCYGEDFSIIEGTVLFCGWNCCKETGGELLKKENVFNHNLIIIPCNEVGNNHWFLLCVYPKVQHVMVLYLIVQLENSLSLHIKDLSLRCGGHWL